MSTSSRLRFRLACYEKLLQTASLSAQTRERCLQQLRELRAKIGRLRSTIALQSPLSGENERRFRALLVERGGEIRQLDANQARFSFLAEIEDASDCFSPYKNELWVEVDWGQAEVSVSSSFLSTSSAGLLWQGKRASWAWTFSMSRI